MVLLVLPAPLWGQGPAKQPDFIPAGYDDYQNMLDQLGIKKVRKGATRASRTPPTRPPRTPTRRACPIC